MMLMPVNVWLLTQRCWTFWLTDIKSVFAFTYKVNKEWKYRVKTDVLYVVHLNAMHFMKSSIYDLSLLKWNSSGPIRIYFKFGSFILFWHDFPTTCLMFRVMIWICKGGAIIPVDLSCYAESYKGVTCAINTVFYLYKGKLSNWKYVANMNVGSCPLLAILYRFTEP